MARKASGPARTRLGLSQLKRQLRADAAAILARPASPVKKVLRVHMRDRLHEVSIALGPPGSLAPQAAAASRAEGYTLYPGQHLGPLESAIWNALAGGQLLVKQIASAVGQNEKAPLVKVAVQLLVARGVLQHARRGRGIERAPLPGP